MAVASFAVQLDQDGNAPLWLGIVAFGRMAEDLLRHDKGELVSTSGRVQIRRWTDPAGQEREQLQLVADAIVSARSVRPKGGRRREDHADRTPIGTAKPSDNCRSFDDDIPSQAR